MKKEVTLIDVAIKSGLTPLEIVKCLGTDHVKQGYKGQHGRDRCIRKDDTFDYLKMSDLFHKGEW
jgi:hypothetical protein